VFVVNLDARKQCSALKMAKALIRISGKKISLALTIKSTDCLFKKKEFKKSDKKNNVIKVITKLKINTIIIVPIVNATNY
jgi:hypothetical protein